MRVKMKSIYAGPTGTHQPGAVVDFSAKEARALVDGGYAVEQSDKPQRRAVSGQATATAGPEEATQAQSGETATATASERAGR